MRKRNLVVSVLVLALVFNFLALTAYADHGKEKGHKGGFESKFYKKAVMLLKNKEELGLSDKQAQDIKALKYDTKNGVIRKKAEIDIIALDIKRAMWEDKIDTVAINKLIDKKYELKKEKTKTLVNAYAKLKGSLTEEQKTKLKALWKQCKKRK